MLIALDIPPGVYRQGTTYQSQGRFYDADLWRWNAGTSRPVGGWVAHTQAAMQGKARAIKTWLDNQNQSWIGVGTHSHLYVATVSGAVTDITPDTLVASGADAVIGGGYGLGAYGAGAYGTIRETVPNINPARVWALDTFGEVLVGTAGRLMYEWTPGTAKAVPVENAPRCNALLVTKERIIMALGAGGDPRAVRWCDAENRTIWTPSSTNLAGGRRLQTNGKLQAGRSVRGGNLLLTDVDAWFVSYSDLPFVYRFDQLATGCGVVSKGAVATMDDRAMWMSARGFWIYNGAVSELACPVADYVFGDINRTQISKATAWENALFSEVWFHYPSADSDENDRYVVYNYAEDHWSIGAIERLAGHPQGVFPYPLLTGDDGILYRHETGDERDGRRPYATSGPVEIGKGDRTMEVHAYIPDERTLGSVEASFSVRDWPMDAPVAVAAVQAASKTDLRFSGRAIAVTFTAEPDVDFRVGNPRFDVKPGSPR